VAKPQAEIILRRRGTVLGRYIIEPGKYSLDSDPGQRVRLNPASSPKQGAQLTFDGAEVRIENSGNTAATCVDGKLLQGAMSIAPHRTVIVDDTEIEVNLLRRLERALEGDAESADSPRPPAEGESLPPRHYSVRDEVARGGMGTILRATDLNIGRTVAMKIILDGHGAPEERRQRFLQEAKLTGQLEHPNIVPVHELGVNEEGKPFYTMKFIEGATLHDVLQELKDGDPDTIERYPLGRLLTIFQKVCDAVGFAHSRGVVHRDLKPQNIMIGNYGEVLVMDWGLAKLVEDRGSRVEDRGSKIEDGGRPSSILYPPSSGLTLSGRVLGTPQFMAPEQAEGRLNEIDERTDVFALGAILYAVLTLQPPVDGKFEEIVKKLRAGQIIPPEKLNRSILGSRPSSRTGAVAQTSKSAVSRVSKPAEQGSASGPPTLHEAPTEVTPGREISSPLAGEDQGEGYLPSSFPHCPGGRIPESLSAVAMKSLSCRREDRYQTVRDLQRDIEAYQGGFATTAEQASPAKLLWLLIKRHKTETIALLAIVLLVTGFMVKVIRSELKAIRSARETLRTQANIDQAAPLYQSPYAEALSLIKEQNFEEALNKIRYAIAISPNEAEYFNLQGDILQSLRRFWGASASYQEALKRDPQHARAKENLALTQRLIERSTGRPGLDLASLAELQAAMRRQERFDEALALLRHLDNNPKRVFETWRDVLAASGLGDRLKMDSAGQLHLDLSNTPVRDLALLKGLPATSLNLANTKVSDLTPLKGMPLKELRLDGCENLRDLTLLAECKQLERITIPSHCEDIDFLRGLPNLKRLGSEFPSGGWEQVSVPNDFRR